MGKFIIKKAGKPAFYIILEKNRNKDYYVKKDTQKIQGRNLNEENFYSLNICNFFFVSSI